MKFWLLQFICWLGFHPRLYNITMLHTYATDFIAGTGIEVWSGVCPRCSRMVTWEQEAL